MFAEFKISFYLFQHYFQLLVRFPILSSLLLVQTSPTTNQKEGKLAKPFLPISRRALARKSIGGRLSAECEWRVNTSPCNEVLRWNSSFNIFLKWLRNTFFFFVKRQAGVERQASKKYWPTKGKSMESSSAIRFR